MKEDKKDKSTIITIAIAAIVIIGVIIFSTLYKQEEKPKEEFNLTSITLDDYFELLGSSEKQVILIGRPSCHYCQEFMPILKNIAFEYNIDINYFDIDTIETEADHDKFINSLEYLQTDDWGTPLLLVVSNNKLDDSLEGYYEKEATLDFFNKNFTLEERVGKIENVDVNTYLTLINDIKPQIMYIGRPSCHYCEELYPILETVAKDYRLTVNYLNVQDLTDEEKDKIIESNDHTKEYGVETPLVLIMKKGKIVNKQVGFAEKGTIISVFKDSDLIN